MNRKLRILEIQVIVKQIHFSFVSNLFYSYQGIRRTLRKTLKSLEVVYVEWELGLLCKDSNNRLFRYIVFISQIYVST